jgi:hypothetical protein
MNNEVKTLIFPIYNSSVASARAAINKAPDRKEITDRVANGFASCVAQHASLTLDTFIVFKDRLEMRVESPSVPGDHFDVILRSKTNVATRVCYAKADTRTRAQEIINEIRNKGLRLEWNLKVEVPAGITKHLSPHAIANVYHPAQRMSELWTLNALEQSVSAFLVHHGGLVKDIPLGNFLVKVAAGPSGLVLDLL